MAVPTPPAPPAVIAPVAPALPALIGADGRPFDLASLRGRWVWLYLGFASCPDACPRALTLLAEADDQLGASARIAPVFVSVDPVRDTPARLKAFTGYYSGRLRGATGTRTALDGLAAAIGASYSVPADAKLGGDYVVGHPDAIFVIDPQGKPAGKIDLGSDPTAAKIAAEMAARLAPGLVASPAPSASAMPDGPTTAEAWCGTPPAAAAADPLAGLMHRARTMGSGTGVLPATSPMRMWMLPAGNWLWMLHGDAVGGANFQGGARGDLTWAAENWQMAMGSRYWGPGIFDVRLMTSLEPFTLPAGGTPQLFQQGESYKGLPLIDKQHPHDLLMELSGRYTWSPTPWSSLFGYAALSGEPALGPVAFMHRPSAADNHWAPLAHHYQDATHITHGVVTGGARAGEFQLEGSVFRGRETDEDRIGVELGALDSWSGRVSWFPGRNLVAQLSHGYLKEPSFTHPGDEARTTASLTGVADTPVGRWSTTALWGRNFEYATAFSSALTLQSYGLESQLDVQERLHAYGRFEFLDRAALPPLPFGSHILQRIGALTLGLSRDLGAIDKWALAIGGDVTLTSVEAFSKAAYGDNPTSFRIYARLRPPTMGAMANGPMAH